MLDNGDFSSGTDSWSLGFYEEALATGSVENGVYITQITEGGMEPWNIQLVQTGITLEYGTEYRISFRARADQERDLIVAVEQSADPWTEYFGDELILTTEMQTFTYDFYMTHGTVNNARIAFNSGGSDINWELEFVSLQVYRHDVGM